EVVGNYFLVPVKCQGGISWEVDSPEPHTAFRSYHEREHAALWAQRGDARRRLQVELGVTPAFRVEHREDGSWQEMIPRKRQEVFGSIVGGGLPS
ncbi:MAG: hypothetical protein KDD44_13535, partial [Bdellovibrionales bacterium]|nr:hypothetical protein [Bdellovibrionales bacterium]